MKDNIFKVKMCMSKTLDSILMWTFLWNTQTHRILPSRIIKKIQRKNLHCTEGRPCVQNVWNYSQGILLLTRVQGRGFIIYNVSEMFNFRSILQLEYIMSPVCTILHFFLLLAAFPCNFIVFPSQILNFL